MTFVYFVTYNVYRSGSVKKNITEEVMSLSWDEIKKMKEETVGNYLDMDEIQRTLKTLYEKRDNGEDAPSAMKINPKKDEN